MSVLGFIIVIIFIGLAFGIMSVLPLPPLVRTVVSWVLGALVLIWLLTMLFRFVPGLNVRL